MWGALGPGLLGLGLRMPLILTPHPFPLMETLSQGRVFRNTTTHPITHLTTLITHQQKGNFLSGLAELITTSTRKNFEINATRSYIAAKQAVIYCESSVSETQSLSLDY